MYQDADYADSGEKHVMYFPMQVVIPQKTESVIPSIHSIKQRINASAWQLRAP